MPSAGVLSRLGPSHAFDTFWGGPVPFKFPRSEGY